MAKNFAEIAFFKAVRDLYVKLGSRAVCNGLLSTKARLKIFAKAKVIRLENNPELLSMLRTDGYKYHTVRMMLFRIEEFDWNCPQHITARFTTEDIEMAWYHKESA